MTHLSEDSQPLEIEYFVADSPDALLETTRGFNDVCLLRLPGKSATRSEQQLQTIQQLASQVAAQLGPQATIITVGEPLDLAHVQAAMPPELQYQLWIAIKRSDALHDPHSRMLPQHHFGALIHTRYSGSLNHTKTRIAYTYCPACDKTSKDYGGKKHTYHQYGTLMSDIWRDVSAELEGDLTPIVERLADLFGLEPYRRLLVCDCRLLVGDPDRPTLEDQPVRSSGSQPAGKLRSTLLHGDSLARLKGLPDNSVDFAFADPPYNLGKKYAGYDDDLEIAEYFDWCDEWITELARILKPGRTVAILNIPLWAVRHLLHMEGSLTFQNWIAWEGLSFPVRQIMPAHYAIICFSKGASRPLPGLTGKAGEFALPYARAQFTPLEPLGEGYCLRSNCVKERGLLGVADRGPLTDLWWDIHRLKHNSRRVDHPCQLPPELLYRLISVFTRPGELVLDPFNGAGTTTLTAHQLGRDYIGIELAGKYHRMAQERHQEIEYGLDPFRKDERVLTAKNSPVPRMPRQTYKVPKKTLQLDVKRIALQLGRLPTREEVREQSKYPIEYFDNYFASWGEVCAAARTTGMSEVREPEESEEQGPIQPSLFSSYKSSIEPH